MRCTVRTRTACFLVITLMIAAPAMAQEIAFNDLTDVGANPLKHEKFTTRGPCDGGLSGGVSRSIGCPPQTYPFKLSLLNVDTTEFQVGGDVVVLLRLQNVGHAAASVPWLTDAQEVELPDDSGTFEFSEADLSANISFGGGRMAYLNVPVHLYGTKRVSGSLQEIGPGEFVELKVKLTLNCKTEQFHCKFVKTGPAELTFTWTESAVRETYGKCGIQSSYRRVRQLTSDAAAVGVVQQTPSR